MFTSEIRFGDGLPKREPVSVRKLTEDERAGRTCRECIRCTKRARRGEKGHHCTMQPYNHDIDPADQACEWFWNKAEQEERDRKNAEVVEKRREELWAVYAAREPVKIPIVNDGFGRIPTCPVCGEVPYDTKQCYWCGQRFIQDEELLDYNTPKTMDIACVVCGNPVTATVSSYNGHKSYTCKNCGCVAQE